MWTIARRAFDDQSLSAFEELYEKLRRSWQVFRGGGTSWPAQRLFGALLTCDSDLRHRKLSSITEEDTPAIWGVLQSINGLKVNKSGPSVVAVSKFLHFWNPRLFVIVDDSVIWNWVLSHTWLRRHINEVRCRTDRRLFVDTVKHDDRACDLATYVAILVWAAKLLRMNPTIIAEFEKYVRLTAKGMPVPAKIVDYEAPALEWFLLGVVELPPCGVRDVGAASSLVEGVA